MEKFNCYLHMSDMDEVIDVIAYLEEIQSLNMVPEFIKSLGHDWIEIADRAEEFLNNK